MLFSLHATMAVQSGNSTFLVTHSPQRNALHCCCLCCIRFLVLYGYLVFQFDVSLLFLFSAYSYMYINTLISTCMLAWCILLAYSNSKQRVIPFCCFCGDWHNVVAHVVIVIVLLLCVCASVVYLFVVFAAISLLFRTVIIVAVAS